jgi:rRNA maturation endonuclease Nob1
MPEFELQTRMMAVCPACGANAPLTMKKNNETGETVFFCPSCGGEVRRSPLDERRRAED